jgi:hypothetical protein
MNGTGINGSAEMAGITEMAGIARDYCRYGMRFLVCRFIRWYEVFRSFRPAPERN